MDVTQNAFMVTDNTSQLFDESNTDLLALDLYSPISNSVCNSNTSAQLEPVTSLTLVPNTLVQQTNDLKQYYNTTEQEFNLLGFENSFLVQNNLNTYDDNSNIDNNAYKWKRFGSVENLMESNNYYTTNRYQESFQDQTSLLNIDKESKA